MTKWLKRLAAITLSVMMALTLFPLIGGVSFTQTAFADDEIVQDDGDVGGGEVVNEEEPAEEVQDADAPTKDGDDGDDPYDPDDPDDPDDPYELEGESIAIEPTNDDLGFELFSDGNNKISIYDQDDTGLSLQVRVGMGFVGVDDEEENNPTVAEWQKQFAKLLVNGKKKDYTFSKGTLTLFGSAIYKKVKGKYDVITVSAALINADGTIVTHSEAEVNVHGVVPDYSDLKDYYNNMTIFPKEGFSLYKTFAGYVQNTAHPYGTDFTCTITKVKTSNKKVVKFKYYKKTKEWEFTGVKKGKATITVTFKGYKKKKTTYKFTVNVVNEGVFMDEIESADREWRGLPGESIVLEANAKYDSYYEGCDYNNIKYEWSILEGDEAYGEIAADPDNNSKAVLTFKDGGSLDEDLDSRTVGVKVKASYEKENGAVLSNSIVTGEPEVMLEYNKFVSDPAIPKNLDIGKPLPITPKIENHTYGSEPQIIEDVEFEFDTFGGDESLTIVDNEDGTFTFTRRSEEYVGVDVSAEWDEGSYETTLDFGYIEQDLEDYSLEFVDSIDYCYYVDEYGVVPEVRVVDRDTGYVLPEDEYELFYGKIDFNENEDEDWDDDWNEDEDWDDDYYEATEPWGDPLTYDYDPLNPWAWNSGFAEYVVMAKATDNNRHGFEGYTENYVDIYSDHGLVPAEVTVDAKYDENKTANDLFYEFDRVQYDIPFGTNVEASDFTVKLREDADALRPGDDYDIMYANWLDEESELFAGFPQEAGEYACYVVGKNGYIGRANAAIFFVGEKNLATIKTSTKTVSYKKLKKKPQPAKPISVKDPSGELVGDLYFVKWSGSSKLEVNPTTGKVTVAKKTKKGTYRMLVNVFLSGDNVTAPIDQLVLVTVKVK